MNASSICLKICDFFFLEIIVPHSHHRSFFFILSNYKLHVLTSVLNRYKSRFDYYFLILELKTSIGGGGGNASCVMRVGFVRNANLYRCRFCLFSRRDISNNDVARNPCNLVNNTKKNFQSERNIHFFNLHLIIGLPFYSSLHDEHNCYPCKNCPFFLFFFFFLHHAIDTLAQKTLEQTSNSYFTVKTKRPSSSISNNGIGGGRKRGKRGERKFITYRQCA